MIDFELRRRFIQLFSLIACNHEVGNLVAGKIYKGDGKYLCAPGLNCYSCPAAAVSCPIGALQAVGGASGFGFSFYVLGFLMMIGVLFGRLVCGFLCPFGLFQELLFKIPLKKRKFYPLFKLVKYGILVLFVISFPIIGAIFSGIGEPAFCKYICPAGTLEGAIPLLFTHSEFRDALGFLFVLKISVLLIIVIGNAIIYRFFCRTLCPLGAIYGIFNKISVYRLNFYKDRCVSCSSCQNACPVELNPITMGNSAECIRCGKCANVCKENALDFKFKF